MADARRDVQPDAGPVVEQGPRLDLHRVTVKPVIEIRRDGDPVAFGVLTAAGLHPALVAGGFGFLLRSKAANPSGLAHSRLRVFDADYVRPGAAPLHDPVAELGSI